MDPFSALLSALLPTPRNILLDAFIGRLKLAQDLKLNATKTAQFMGTNRRTLQRAIDSNFTSLQQRTIATALARVQQNAILYPERVGKNFSIFTTPIGTQEWVNQVRDNASVFGTPQSFKMDISTEEMGYEGYKSVRSTDFRMFDDRLITLQAAGMNISQVSRITIRY
mgnify:CR=1 FL=1